MTDTPAVAPLTPPASQSELVLTPPQPVAAIPPEKVGGMVPLDQSALPGLDEGHLRPLPGCRRTEVSEGLRSGRHEGPPAHTWWAFVAVTTRCHGKRAAPLPHTWRGLGTFLVRSARRAAEARRGRARGAGSDFNNLSKFSV